ncbi:ATP-binding protein [Planococcus sp. ISL-109]|uniref:ATP-binding protein n=1 Tax=Planococcus sp. ISL-109 TaxID=2819166 RepID=UPI001BE6ED65|nr:ATP-binding protein [Planococcus sp. ISL-109]MBT2581769.1 PAS domain S-box protein [Planococcus sp. ISL-109]
MDSSLTNRKRNQLFIHLFGFSSLAHLTLNFFVESNAAIVAPIFGMVAYMFLFTLLYTKLPPARLRLAVLFAINAYIVILQFESLSSVTAIYFIIPIIAASLYNDTLSIIALSALTVIEVLLLTFVFDLFEARSSLEYIHVSMLTFFGLVMLLAVLHSSYFSSYWRQLELRNASMKKALVSKEGYLELFFQAAKDAIAVFDSEGRIIAINPAFEQLYGWTADDSLGKVIALYPPEHAKAAEMRAEQVRLGENFTLETDDIKKDGTRFPAQITLSPIFDAHGKVIATSVISRDISYRKETERMLLQTEKLKMAGEIAAGVAHEIRNPMTVISGFVQMMHNDPNHLYPSYTSLMQSELDRINLIISEFLILAKPQAPELKSLDVGKILDECIFLFGPEFAVHDIVVKTDSTGPFRAEGEENHLKQVFINLLKNAIEAMEEGGTLRIAARQTEADKLTISFEDEGPGIPLELIERVFEPFYTTKPTGTGLGLLISQKIIQEHGGSLAVKNRKQQGTCVIVTLPLSTV